MSVWAATTYCAANWRPRLCWCWAGSWSSWCWCTSSSSRRRRAASATPRRRTCGLSVVATAVVALGFDRRAVMARGRHVAVVHGGPAVAVRGAAPVLAAVDRAAPAEETCRPGWPRVLAEGTGGEWAQVWLMVGDRFDARRNLATRRDGSPAVEAPDRQARPARPTGAGGAPGGELLGRSGGAGARRTSRSPRSRNGSSPGSPTRPGWCCAARGCGPSSCSGARSCPRARRNCGVAATARRRPGRRAATARARHPRRRSTASGRARGEPAAGPHPGRTARRSGPIDCWRSRQGGRRDASRRSPACSRGIYPSLLVDEGLAAALRTAIAAQPACRPIGCRWTSAGTRPSVEAAAYFCALEALQNVGEARRRRRRSAWICEAVPRSWW